MRAELVYDGSKVYYKPECMGEPKETQLQGTARECVTELCGRICYDSLGKGRSSAEYHKHIMEVRHLSVQEHTPITILQVHQNQQEIGEIFRVLANRPGIYCIVDGGDVRITANFRAINEWFADEYRNRYEFLTRGSLA